MVVIKYPKFIQTGEVTNVSTSSTIVVFPLAFDTAPKVIPQWVDSSTVARGLAITSISTSSFVIQGSASGTVHWTAIYTT